MGWVVCEMTGHANKLHHFWLSGQGQCHAICQSGGLWVKGWMGLISMCSLRSLTPPPSTPKTTQLQTLCYHHTHTQKALSGDCLGQWCDTDIRADTSAVSQKPKHPEINFNARVGLEERHCSCSRQSHHSDTYCITFPTDYLLYSRDKFSSEFCTDSEQTFFFLPTLYLFHIYFLLFI